MSRKNNILSSWGHPIFRVSIIDHGSLVINDRGDARPLVATQEEKYKIKKISTWAFHPTLALFVFSNLSQVWGLFVLTFNNGFKPYCAKDSLILCLKSACLLAKSNIFVSAKACAWFGNEWRSRMFWLTCYIEWSTSR